MELRFETDEDQNRFFCRGDEGCGAWLDGQDFERHRQFHRELAGVRVAVDRLLAAVGKPKAGPADPDEVRRRAIEGAW